MKNFFQALALSAIVLILVGVVVNTIVVFATLGFNHPQYGVPALVFVWMALAWTFNAFETPKLKR